jgi:hypothetical protein
MAGHQLQIVNFFLGREGVRRPTQREQRLIVNQRRNTDGWPAAESSFMTDTAIGVVLQACKPRGFDHLAQRPVKRSVSR